MFDKNNDDFFNSLFGDMFSGQDDMFKRSFDPNKFMGNMSNFDFSDTEKWDTESESVDGSFGNVEKITYTSKDGKIKIVSYKKSGNGDDVKTPANEISKMQKELNKAVKNEDFETAAKLRDSIMNYTKNSVEIEKLKKELNEAIKNQDFEKAILFRDKIKNIK